MEATRPQKISGWLVSTVGPGVMPWIMKAESIIAIMSLNGMPSVGSGMKDAWAAALLAASGAATPLTTPVPNLSGCFKTFFSTEGAPKDASVAPRPGSSPIRIMPIAFSTRPLARMVAAKRPNTIRDT